MSRETESASGPGVDAVNAGDGAIGASTDAADIAIDAAVEHNAKLTRREILVSGALAFGTLAAGRGARELFERFQRKAIPGRVLGPSFKDAHRLRERGPLPPPRHETRVGIAIVGGGVAGLAAAWQLRRRGFNDFVILELEAAAGGNSAFAETPLGRAPWGAHYVPIPGAGVRHVRAVFEDLGVITGYEGNLPVFDELALCSDPQERLLVHGRWQEGLLPETIASEEDRRQYERFYRRVAELKNAHGSDGRRAFDLPLDESSRDDRFTRLDQITMAQWLSAHGFDSKPLRWHVDYCCRDDYGAGSAVVSAWAGLHYFASRDGRAANADAKTVLTWPEGNGWITERLSRRVSDQLRARRLVHTVDREPDGSYVIDAIHLESGRGERVRAQSIVFAAPLFVASRVIKEFRHETPKFLRAFSYAPWMTANVTLAYAPRGRGAPLSWDNVSYHSRSLGYIHAGHQNVRTHSAKRALVTTYRPLDNEIDPKTARETALKRDHGSWAAEIAFDFERMHPGIGSSIENIDIWLWGHGMPRPVPGLIWGEERARAQRGWGRIHFAHSDVSGLSIFEEAFERGVGAADRAIVDVRGSRGIA